MYASLGTTLLEKRNRRKENLNVWTVVQSPDASRRAFFSTITCRVAIASEVTRDMFADVPRCFQLVSNSKFNDQVIFASTESPRGIHYGLWRRPDEENSPCHRGAPRQRTIFPRNRSIEKRNQDKSFEYGTCMCQLYKAIEWKHDVAQMRTSEWFPPGFRDLEFSRSWIQCKIAWYCSKEVSFYQPSVIF